MLHIGMCSSFILTFIFSCEDAAQQVLMSVCLSVCPQPEKIPSYILLQHKECSRMFQKVSECMQKVPECIQKVSECIQKVSECMQNVPECMQNVPECMQNVPKCTQIYELACSSLSFHAVTQACMQSLFSSE